MMYKRNTAFLQKEEEKNNNKINIKNAISSQQFTGKDNFFRKEKYSN